MVKGKKIVSLFLVTAMVFSMLTACGDNAVPAMATVGADSGLSAYELAVQQGYDGTLEDWLQSLQGKSAYEIAVEHGYSGTEDEWIGRLNSLAAADSETYVKTASFNSAGQLILTLSDGTTLNIGGGLAAKGADGANGRDGANGSNGANGKDGQDGKDGQNGKDGANGKNGQDGKDGISIAGVTVNEKGELIVSFSDGKATNVGKVVGTSGLDGKDGLSAYEIAVITGATTAATEAEWLESLKGAAGADGQTPYVGDNGNWWIGTTDTGVVAGGRNGTDGAAGKSAYEIAKENGCTLSETEWLASLKGTDGQNGSDGRSAYEIAKEAGLTTAATEAEWLESLKGAAGADGQDGRDGKDGRDGLDGKDGVDGKDGADGKDGIDGKDGDTPFIGDNGNWWIGTTDTGVKAAGPQGEQGLKGDKGDKGDTGAQGASGKSAYEIAIEKNLITNAVTEEQWLASLKGEKGSQGEQGVGIQNITLNNGTMTITLTDDTQFQFENIGSASSGGTAPQIRINTQTNEWEISSDSGNSWVSTGVKATGEKGADGVDGVNGEDGISPKVQINMVTNEWEISVNNGLSWTSTGVKATGTDGKDGDTPFVGDNGNWWIGTTDTGVKAAGQDGRDGQNGVDGKDGQNGADGQDGKDGDTPFVGSNGNWWIGATDTGVKAAGQDGRDGQNGVDGKDGQSGADGKDGKDGKDGDTPFVGSNGNWWIGTTDTGVKAAGQDGRDGQNGVDGKDGKDGVSVTGVTINDENKLVITLSEGDPIIIDKSLMGAAGAAGADGKDGNGISSVTLTPDFCLVFHYTDGTDSGKLGPIKGEKGDKGDAGVGIANVSLDADGNLYITYSNADVPILLGTVRGPKGDTGAAGPKGDPGADGKDGVGIKNAYVNSERHLVLELTDGTTIDAGYVGVSDEPANTHTVIFKDWDGTELKRETVADGASATAPSDPSRSGYVFAGWDKSFSNITADTVITATYTVSEKTPVLKVSSNTAAPGATKVTVTVSLENNPGFLTMALEMAFDSDVLILTKVSNGVDFTDYNFTGPKNKVSGCRAAWFSTDLPDEILDGDVMTLQFTVADNAASGRYPITISCPDDGSTLDGNKNVIALANAIGYITVG